MSDFIIDDKLGSIYDRTDPLPLRNKDKIIIFSDFHLGDGGSKDDFSHNSRMVLRILREYYLENGYTLILNGDIEELQRFELRKIEQAWKEFYEILDAYRNGGRLHKLVGNHDYELRALRPRRYPYRVEDALRFTYGKESVFVIHGHQASGYFDKWHAVNSFVLRYIANPLGITNKSVAYDSKKRFRTEKRIYDFSSEKQIITIIGHTHRPLFESHSKTDELKFKIEQQLREYTGSGKRKQRRIREEVAHYKQELEEIYRAQEASSIESSLYNQLIVPSVFNSGCAIGKRGTTGIEIRDGAIRLIHWFDRNRSDKYLNEKDETLTRHADSDYYRVELKGDSLDYVFARINLLA